MMWKNSQQQYGAISKILHWLLAFLMIGLIALGWYMVGLTYYDPWYNDSLNLHKAIGILLFGLVLIKTTWTLSNIKPALPVQMSRYKQLAARVIHGLLFLLMLVIPVTGYIISISAGDSISIFGWFQIPALLSIDEATRDNAIEIHYFLAYTTLYVVSLHVLAAFKHQFIDRDGTLRKILW